MGPYIPVILISILYLVADTVKYKAIGAGLLVEGKHFAVPPVHEDRFVGYGFCEGGGGEGVAESPADLGIEGQQEGEFE